MKLNIEIGANGRRMEGWTCLDSEKECDIRKPLQWGDNTVDNIHCEHVFEHVTPAQGLRFLDECYRILKPGGCIRLCVPVVGNHLETKHARDLIFNHGHEAAYTLELLKCFLEFAGFDYLEMKTTGRRPIDNHWQTIGKELDDLETCRIEAYK